MEGINTTDKDDLEGGGGAALQAPREILPATEFVKVEKNLASFGFFTPSSKRLRNAQEKSFTITTTADGQRLELKGTIIPSAKYGLPITADQDKWIALCKLLNDIIRREGRVANPVSFTSAEILRLLHKHRHSGKNYREIEEWLDVLFSTTIFSEGVVYLAREKRRVKDRFRVFDRAVSFGKEMPDGKVADKNYVWFSDWQLQNINSNHLLPIDLEAYRELKNHIAKALVPLLQVWLYATRREGVFEKRYDELCQILNIQQYPYESWIKRTLGVSLEELKQFGYLAEWRIDKTNDKESYKIVFYHGEKFYRDRNARLSRKPTLTGEGTQVTMTASAANDHSPQIQNRPATVSRSATLPRPNRVIDPQLVAEFTRRGVNEKKANDLLANLKPGQDRNLISQLEYADETIRQLQNSANPVRNPAGFIISFIERNPTLPDNFETSAQRKTRLERERREAAERDAHEARQFLEDEYERYCFAETDRYIAEHPDIFEAIKAAKLAEEEHFSSNTWYGRRDNIALAAAKWEIRKQVPLLAFDEFLERKKQGNEVSSEPVEVPQSAIPESRPATVGEGSSDPGALPMDLLAAEERREAELAAAMEAKQPTIELAKAGIEPPVGTAPEIFVPEVESMASTQAAPPADSKPMMLHEIEPAVPETETNLIAQSPEEDLGDASDARLAA